MANAYENQQKRIAFLSLHRDLIGGLKPVVEIDGKKHEELCKYTFVLVENLFKTYPNTNGKADTPTIKSEELPL